ncbi:MAG: ferritin-like domain-containing protein, partial [candidate division NC10 bacterium]
MQGHPQITELLNNVLRKELTGINQYFVHAKMCENWGYQVLAKANRDEAMDEMKHAERSSIASCSSTEPRICPAT